MRYQINLFPPKEQNIADKIIYFSFHYLRYILVLTQMVVICVFFYRFKIDQEVVDLKDSIKQKGEIISVSTPLLQEIQAIDIKMQSVDRSLSDQQRLRSMYTYFLSTFPAELHLTKFQLTKEGIFIDGFTQNVNTVRIYNHRMTNEKRFREVNLESLKREDLNYTFSFSFKKFNTNNE